MCSNDCDDAVICGVSHTRSGGWGEAVTRGQIRTLSGGIPSIRGQEQPGQPGRDQMKRINKSKNFPFSITHVLVSMNFCLIQAFWHLEHFHGKNFVELNVKWKYFFQSFITSSLDSQQRVKSGLIKVKSFSLEHSLWCQISPLTMLFRILLIDCPVPREKLWRILKWYFLLFCRRAK